MIPIPVLDGIVNLGTTLIDRIFPDKEKQADERAKAQLALVALNQEGELKTLATQMSAILAEAQSADPWTSRARPSFLYVIYIMILMGIPMGFLAAFRPDIATAVAGGMQKWLAAIPESLYTLFGVGYLGYAGSRSYEKGKGVTK
jgi:hypothetical protein